ncbi:MAG: RIO1 family regulatory kinase/ATPase [Candidatus Hodarchaeota archaeon]
MDHFKLVSQLEKEEFRVLNAIEIGMRKFEMVPFTNLPFYTRYDPEEVRHWLDKVHKKDLIIRESGKKERYILNSKGYDLLALHALAEKDVVASIGNSLGVGKESDVYQAISPSGEKLALKFHRIGRTSFRAVMKKRDYATGKRHYSWLYLSRLSAAREAGHLKKLNEINIAVPKFITHNRHVVVMALYQGQEIHEFPRLENPGRLFKEVIDNVKRVYQEAGLIHCDLGEFNIIYTLDEKVLIIDWPQAVERSHPNAEVFLRRDLENICVFFQKQGIDCDENAFYDEITSNSD